MLKETFFLIILLRSVNQTLLTVCIAILTLFATALLRWIFTSMPWIMSNILNNVKSEPPTWHYQGHFFNLTTTNLWNKHVSFHIVHQETSATSIYAQCWQQNLVSALLIESVTEPFICEHDLPILLTSKLVQLCKYVNRDQKVLRDEISMFFSSATYKIVDSLGFFIIKLSLAILVKVYFQ